MRELKFRIWDKQYCQWLENSSSLHCYSNWTICPFTGKLVDYIGAIDGDHGDTFTASPADDHILQGKFLLKPRYIIQQYTGMKDSKGIEIYEGDVVTFRPKSNKGPFYVIRYDSEYAMFVAKEDDRYILLDTETDLPLSLKTKEIIRVLGNIFENPELLEQ
jgi:uncharacterized phage protein (TIGR01671 family)